MEDISEKKQAIFDSTLDLIKQHGFHGCPMSSVAKNAGVAAGTIYHYFESKDQLICELFTYTRGKMISILREGDDENKPYEERFFALWNNLFRFYVEEPHSYKFFEQFVNSPYYNKSHDRLFELISDFFAKGINQGHLRSVNPEILGVLAHSSVITAAKIHQFKKIPFAETEQQQVAQIIWDGMVIQRI
ncbi:TetR/AcrR family transcriptional regulator [Catalinimonas niigatensis]|uniref:TetR/AcrR family transcriptional regulator n=1 Tax=Catalinimonas niigatensis TaxID=1397264 RepID=UPI002665CBDA|nr:TetR/AcrR family transcriptional regulator [Catalinimonas niigatensis]WPP52106.1 TetR/AcrR family transcriptional regulator [Catalinimonas niigatensis]